MTRPPWWRPFARRRWEREQRERSRGREVTTASLDSMLRSEFVADIVSRADEDGHVTSWLASSRGRWRHK